MAFQHIRLQPISGSLGAIVHGVDLRQPLTDAASAPRASSSTDVFKAAGDEAEKRVKQIISTQLGRALRG